MTNPKPTLGGGTGPDRPQPVLAAALSAREAHFRHAELIMQGSKASALSLGIAMPLDHGAQMRCGAMLLRPAPFDVAAQQQQMKREGASGASAVPSAAAMAAEGVKVRPRY